jgi:gas vesicle protein
MGAPAAVAISGDKPVNDERYDRYDSGGSKVAVAFVAGLAVGAGVALLLAPQSGAETRAEIARQARRARLAAGEMATKVRERAGEAYETTRTQTRRRMGEARRGVETAVEEVKTRVEAGRQAAATGARAAREDFNQRLADMRTENPEGNGA